MSTYSLREGLLAIVVAGIALGYFEAAVVVYIRELSNSAGFLSSFGLIPKSLLKVEIFRELASILLLVAIATLAAKRFRDRLGYFLILFGLWDVFYYVWLKVTINWPSSLLEWDVLFLIPLPWTGPVIAPLLIANMMIGIGTAIVFLSARDHEFRSPILTSVLYLLGTAVILYSFTNDAAAIPDLQAPRDYNYGLLIAGLIVYLAAFRMAVAGGRSSKTNP